MESVNREGTAGSIHYVTRVVDTPASVPADAWNQLLLSSPDPSPFARHEYLLALHESGCAIEGTGWTPRFVTLWQGQRLCAACALYLKQHSYGEYVFDWAWANAHQAHGLSYYPKGLVAIPFTPVPGARLLARDDAARHALLKAVLTYVHQSGLSSLHLLFLQPQDLLACEKAGLMLRHTVQFHWRNDGYRSFEGFLGALSQDKRKKIRQERRKVSEAGIRFRALQGVDITDADWDFFYRCYARTYREHGNPPYLNHGFFARIGAALPDHWVLFLAEREGTPLACSLVGLDPARKVAYGRYWGAMERVDCLHFEACYYQPLAWCIEHGYRRFEGGAQGEHKMARALLPETTTSAHWLAHPAFAEAVERFLERERDGVSGYLEHLATRTPLRDNPRSEPDNG